MKAVEIEFLMKGNLKQGLREVGGEADVLDSRLRGLRNTVGGIFAVDKSAEYIKKIVDVRGEIESLQISFETLAGKTKGDKLFGDIKEFATSTPMMMNDLAKGAQTLLGFNIEAEKVMPILHQIGDISMGDSQKFNSLVLAFAQMSSTGKLMGQDLLQMINAGFNPLVVIAEKTGKSISTLKEEMSDGKISVEMVADAFASATGEGGKFHGMLERQSKGMKGAVSNLEGAWQDAMNAMGESSEGFLMEGIELATSAVKNYEKLGAAIFTVIAAYGEYKGTLMAVQALQNVMNRQKTIIEADRVNELKELVDKYKNANTDAINNETAATQANTAAKAASKTAIDVEVAAVENELRAHLAAAEAKSASAFAEHEFANQMVDDAVRGVAAAQENLQATLQSGDAKAIESAQEELNTAVKERNTAEEVRNAAAKNSTAAYTHKQAAAQQLSTFQTQVDTVQKNANTRATSLWAAATRMATTAMQSLKAAFMSNPFGIALVAITSMVGLLSMFSSETEKAADVTNRFRDKVLQQQSQLDTYHATLANVEKGSKSYKTALDGINAVAKEYNTQELSLNDTLADQKRKYEDLTEAIRQQAAERTLAEAAAKANEDAMNAEKDAMDSLMEKAKDATYKEMREVVESTPEGVTVMVNKTVDVASEKLRQVTSATWNMISTEIMNHAADISAAFAKSQEDGTKAVEEEVRAIEGILQSLGVTDKEIEAFHDNLYEYVEKSAMGFSDSYGELERTKAQLEGIANAVVETKDTTNEAISQMNYEQLVQKMQSVQTEIDSINSKEIRVETDNTRLLELKTLLTDINKLLPNALTVGSDADLEKRLQELKKQRDGEIYGSKNWKNYNKQIGRLTAQLSSHKSNYAETIQRENNRKSKKKKKEKKGLSKEEIARQQARYQEIVEEQKEARKRAVRDMELETRQAQIDAMREGSKKTLEQIQLDFEKEKEKINREYEDLKKGKIEAAQKAWEANPANKKKVFHANPSDSRFAYTKAEEENKKAQEEAARQDFLKKRSDVFSADRQAMRDYLKEYGTFNQQKLAIAEEYAEKIKKATTEGERKKLIAERDSAQGKIEVEAIKQSIDWGSAFSEFGALFKSELDPLLSKLRKITESKDFKNSSVQDQSIVFELIHRLEQSAAAWDGEIFKKVSDDMVAYQAAMEKLIAAQEVERHVYEETADSLKDAREKLEQAQAEGNTEEMARWQAEVDRLVAEQNAASTAVSACGKAANEATENLKASADRAKGMFEGLEGAISGLTSGTLKGIGNALMRLDKLFGGGETTKAVGNAFAKGVQTLFGKDSSVSKALSTALGNTGMMGEVISAMLGILDTIAQNGISGIVTSLQDTILGAVEKMLEEVFSGNIIMKPLSNSMQHLNNILDTVTFGGFHKLTSLLGDGDSDKHLERDLEKLTQSNADLKQALENLTDEMSKAKVNDAGGLYEQQKKNIREQERNAQEKMARSGKAYTNGDWYKAWTNGKHSSNYKIDKGMSSREWDAISKLLGKEVRSASDFWKLSSKEMYEVATKLTSEYSHLKDLANDGYKDAAQFMDDYIGYWKQLEQIENAYREKMTGISFDSARESLKSLVKDVKNGSREVLKSVDEMFQDAILNSLMSNKYSEKLQEWYKAFAAAMEDGLSNGEASSLREMYKKIFDEMNKERDEAYKSAGIDPTDSTQQAGRSGAFETMTHDQGTKLEGLFTSGQLHWASMDSLLAKIAERWTAASDQLAQLVENTSYCKHLKDISEDIKSIKRDGFKMR